MTARTEVIQIRVSPDEKKQIERRAKKEKASVSELIRKALTTPQMVPVPIPVEELSAAVKAQPGLTVAQVEEFREEQRADNLAERREARARELARTMPLVNARQLAAREIPE
jgi:hypothetical protein